VNTDSVAGDSHGYLLKGFRRRMMYLSRSDCSVHAYHYMSINIHYIYSNTFFSCSKSYPQGHAPSNFQILIFKIPHGTKMYLILSKAPACQIPYPVSSPQSPPKHHSSNPVISTLPDGSIPNDHRRVVRQISPNGQI
jgi:hypothetical protein